MPGGSPTSEPTLLVLCLSAPSVPALKSALALSLPANPRLKKLHILSAAAPTLSDLKLHALTLAGRLARNDLAIAVHALPTDWTPAALAAALEPLTSSAGPLVGVLLDLPSPPGHGGAERGMLDLSAAQLEAVLRAGLGAVHAVARVAVPALLLGSAAAADVEECGFFALMSGGSGRGGAAGKEGFAARLGGFALEEVRRAVRGSDGRVTVGHVEDVFPAPPPPPPPPAARVDERRNGQGQNGGPFGGFSVDVPPRAEGFEADPGESPTKLWTEWALQEEFDEPL